MQNANGKYAIIVGASSGIGVELAQKLAREGYQLTLLARRADRLNTLCDSINAEVQEERARYVAHDVTDYEPFPRCSRRSSRVWATLTSLSITAES